MFLGLTTQNVLSFSTMSLEYFPSSGESQTPQIRECQMKTKFSLIFPSRNLYLLLFPYLSLLPQFRYHRHFT